MNEQDFLDLLNKHSTFVDQKCIEYKSGYKYQLKSTYTVLLPFQPKFDIVTHYIIFNVLGECAIKTGYAWDGPSGPTIDTPSFMRGSLVHDALSQLMRYGHLNPIIYRKPIDKLLISMCKEDKMWALRRKWVYAGVRLGGGASSRPSSIKPLIFAPSSCK
jgi:hypothetical protein